MLCALSLALLCMAAAAIPRASAQAAPGHPSSGHHSGLQGERLEVGPVVAELAGNAVADEAPPRARALTTRSPRPRPTRAPRPRPSVRRTMFFPPPQTTSMQPVPTTVRPVETTTRPPPPPTTSRPPATTAPPVPTANPNQTFSFCGRASWYNTEDPSQNHGWSGMGSCGNRINDAVLGVAMNAPQYRAEMCTNRMQVDVLDVERGIARRFTVVDRCVGCPWGGLDLTPGSVAAFGRYAGKDRPNWWEDAEFPICWRFVS